MNDQKGLGGGWRAQLGGMERGCGAGAQRLWWARTVWGLVVVLALWALQGCGHWPQSGAGPGAVPRFEDDVRPAAPGRDALPPAAPVAPPSWMPTITMLASAPGAPGVSSAPTASNLFQAPSGGQDLLALPALAAGPEDLWARMRQGFALPALQGEAAVRADQAAQRYARSGLLERSAQRAQLYLYVFVDEAEKRGLPLELALLPYVESALNPHARSPVGAVGACQFMPATGLRFELAQSAWVDQRRDVQRCASAMFDYLSENHARLGSWHLALAAYNWGEGAVGRAVAKSVQAGGTGAYESLRMPNETLNYVPALLGLAQVVAQPLAFGARLPQVANVPPWVQVDLPADMDVQRVLQWAGISAQAFERLNPGILRPVIPRSVQPSILLPPEAAERFVQARALAGARGQKGQALASWGAWRVQRTESLALIAKRLGVGVDVLAQANDMALAHRVVAGSVLAVPMQVRQDMDAHSASLGVLRTLAPAPVRAPVAKHASKAGRKAKAAAAPRPGSKAAPAPQARRLT